MTTPEYVAKEMITDSGKKIVMVDKGISFIYQIVETATHTNYRMITYRDRELLDCIERFILGVHLSNVEYSLLSKVVIRFGWVDTELLQISWVSLSEMVEGFVNKTLEPSHRNKFNFVLRQLSLSTKEARKAHRQFENGYHPAINMAMALVHLDALKNNRKVDYSLESEVANHIS